MPPLRIPLTTVPTYGTDQTSVTKYFITGPKVSRRRLNERIELYTSNGWLDAFSSSISVDGNKFRNVRSFEFQVSARSSREQNNNTYEVKALPSYVRHLKDGAESREKVRGILGVMASATHFSFANDAVTSTAISCDLTNIGVLLRTIVKSCVCEIKTTLPAPWAFKNLDDLLDGLR